MPKIISANRANVLIDGQPVEGLQEVTYESNTPYSNVEAIGSSERIAVVRGATAVTGFLRARSVIDVLEEKMALPEPPFQIFVSAEAEPGGTPHEITLAECYVHGKKYGMTAGNVAETVYEFSATREQK